MATIRDLANHTGFSVATISRVLKNYVVRACMEQGYNVSYLAEKEGKYHTLEKEAVDGILAIGIFSENQIAQMMEISRSIVFIDSSPDENQFDSVVLPLTLTERNSVRDDTKKI